MADAKQAPLKLQENKISKEDEYLAMEFDANKKYLFELAVQNMQRELPVVIMDGQKTYAAPHRKFPPFRNIVFTSQIIWKGQRRNIRYYDGCTSIFVDEQPKDKEEIDQLIAQTRKRNFLDGKFGCYGDERMLLLYMNICSWNANSPFRTRSADAIFVSVDTETRATEEIKKLDAIEDAIALAREATETKMMIHAAYLGVEMFDFDREAEKSSAEIRALYRRKAIENPELFLSSYGNKDIELKYYIDKAWETGLINNKQNPNKASWAKSGREICDISGLKSADVISQKIFEFAKLDEGAEFVIQLQALFK
jgi:hypothetical protein